MQSLFQAIVSLSSTAHCDQIGLGKVSQCEFSTSSGASVISAVSRTAQTQICCAGNAPFADAYRDIFGLLLDEIHMHAHLQSWRLIWLSVSVPLVQVAIHIACADPKAESHVLVTSDDKAFELDVLQV